MTGCRTMRPHDEDDTDQVMTSSRHSLTHKSNKWMRGNARHEIPYLTQSSSITTVLLGRRPAPRDAVQDILFPFRTHPPRPSFQLAPKFPFRSPFPGFVLRRAGSRETIVLPPSTACGMHRARERRSRRTLTQVKPRARWWSVYIYNHYILAL